MKVTVEQKVEIEIEDIYLSLNKKEAEELRDQLNAIFPPEKEKIEYVTTDKMDKGIPFDPYPNPWKSPLTWEAGSL